MLEVTADEINTSNETNTSSSSSSSDNNVDNNNRQSESPARTIDSHDSTTGSMDTIVDRNLNREQMLQTTIEHSTNRTNAQQQHDSLTDSQISMLQQTTSSDEEQHQHQQQKQQQHKYTTTTTTNIHPQHQQHNMQQQQQQQQQQSHQIDAQNHIYSSPVYDQKPPLKLSAATILATVASDVKNVDDAKKLKLITHEEFQKQLQEAVASRAATLDSRISKKQRLPPELIKCKDSDGGSSVSASKVKHQRKTMPSSDCCSAFPLQIILGTIQLVLSVSLVALGTLLILREASLSTAGCGIWTGLIAAVTGSLGVVSMRKTQTAFLALSLVCIATSTLALAITGAGLSRDINRLEQKFDLMNSNNEISASCGLIFTLFLHFVVSIVSVYRCALQICSK